MFDRAVPLFNKALILVRVSKTSGAAGEGERVEHCTAEWEGQGRGRGGHG